MLDLRIIPTLLAGQFDGDKLMIDDKRLYIDLYL